MTRARLATSEAVCERRRARGGRAAISSRRGSPLRASHRCANREGERDGAVEPPGAVRPSGRSSVGERAARPVPDGSPPPRRRGAPGPPQVLPYRDPAAAAATESVHPDRCRQHARARRAGDPPPVARRPTAADLGGCGGSAPRAGRPGPGARRARARPQRKSGGRVREGSARRRERAELAALGVGEHPPLVRFVRFPQRDQRGSRSAHDLSPGRRPRASRTRARSPRRRRRPLSPSTCSRTVTAAKDRDRWPPGPRPCRGSCRRCRSGR